MSRGVVLWPDAFSGAAVRELWRQLASAGLPSLETHTHRLHQPHVSLVVAEDLDVAATARAVGLTPREPIPFRIEMAGVFPGGVLALPIVPTAALMDEQRRVSEALSDIAVGRWPHTHPDVWSPHMTCAYGLSGPELEAALAIALQLLPLAGYLDTGGIEDGSSGENWPSA